MDTNTLRVVIAGDEPITRMDLKEILESKGYSVVGEAADGFDAVEICKKTKADLVLMDIKMPLLDGLSAANIVLSEGLVDTVVPLTAYSEREFIDKAKDIGVGGYLVKPVDEKSIISNIELAVARSRELRKLSRDMEKVTKRLEDRGVIERAKGIVMKRDDLSESEAYDYIRKISQGKNVSMRRVAEIILLQGAG